MKGHGWYSRGRSRGKKNVADTGDARGFAALLVAYLQWLRTRNYSEATVYTRERTLQQLIEWAALRGLTRPADVTKPVLERYQRHLFYYRKKDGKPLSFVSQKQRLVPVRMFFQWLARQNVLLSNPASDLELPRLPFRLPKAVLSAEEADRVMAAVEPTNAMAVRDRAILETFYSTGIRRKELIHLRLTDFDPGRGMLMVREGKGKKDRMLPIGERAILWIERYLAELRPRLVVAPDEGWLFLTDSGDSLLSSRLTKLVATAVARAGLSKRGSCHLFRHTMATLMLENGADIRFIQRMLGHASLNSTEIYTQVSIRKLQEIHRATHPSARMATATATPSDTRGDADAEKE